MIHSVLLVILVLLQAASACSVSSAFNHCRCLGTKPLLLNVSNMKELSKLLPDRFKECHLEIRLININIIRYGDLPTISQVKKVSIFGDKVRYIESGAFELWNATKSDAVKCLELSNMQLTGIRKQTFDGLHNLEKLNISYNDISHMQEGALIGLDNLLYLYIEHNLIIQMGNETFTGL